MIIRLEALRIAGCAPPDDTDSRYNLAAIQVRADGTVIACDGHIAIRMASNTEQPSLFDELLEPTEAEQERDLIISAGEAKAFFDASKKLIKKGKEANPVHVTVALRGGEVKVATADGLVARRFDIKFNEDQKFPDMDRVIPKAKPETAVTFDIEQLTKVVRTCKQIGARYFTFEPGKTDKDAPAPWRFSAKAAAGFIDGALMPCIGVGPDESTPEESGDK